MPIDVTEFLPLAAVARAIPDPDGPSVAGALDAALSAGLAPERIAEAILQGIPYAGFPGAVEALGALAERTPYSPLPPRSDDPPVDSWTDADHSPPSFVAIYRETAPAVRAALRGRHPDLERWIIAFAYGTVMERGILGLAELEGLAVASLVGQRRRTPLHSHLRGAIRSGWSAEQLETLLDALAETADPATIAYARSIVSREA